MTYHEQPATLEEAEEDARMAAVAGATTAERVLGHIVDFLEVDPTTVTRDSRLIEDLGADSLDYIELTMAIEEAFDTEIRDDEVETLQSFGQIVDFLEARVTAGTAR